jgi:hypothetical protein
MGARSATGAVMAVLYGAGVLLGAFALMSVIASAPNF